MPAPELASLKDGPRAGMPWDRNTSVLILWRHADAHEGYPDSARALTPLGLGQAERMARWLAARLPPAYRLVASPALRAQQTARALREDFQTLPALAPNASPRDVLAAMDWEMPGRVTLVVGHQPTLGRLASLLLGGEEQPWHVDKGAVWWLERRSGVVTLRASLTPDFA